MKNRIFPQLDGLRGLAALLVLVHHYWPELGRFDPTGGRLGVDIFFVLSGFLITRSLGRAQDRSPGRFFPILQTFWIRRLVRIVPVFYITMALSLYWHIVNVTGFFWHISFLSNLYFICQGRYVGAGAHLWALAVEQHFYLFWPLILLAFPRKYLTASAMLLIGVGLSFRIAAGVLGWSHLTIDVMTPGAFEALGCGALLAGWMQKREETPLRMDSGISSIGFAGLALLGLRLITASTSYGYAVALLFTELSRSLMLSWLVAQAVWGIPGLTGRWLESAPLRALGYWSYGIYLSHNFSLALFQATNWHWKFLSPHNTQALLAFGATLAYSWICFEWLEKPFSLRTVSENNPARSPASI